jgi:hypothetical protein
MRLRCDLLLDRRAFSRLPSFGWQADGRIIEARRCRETRLSPAQKGQSMATSDTVSASGISLGAAIAVTVSWSLHHSLVWAIVHGFFGWFYVIYYALTR